MIRCCVTIVLAGSLLLSGCSADWYRRSADRQVGGILSDRTKTTLGYEPQVDVPTTVDPTPARAAYAKIPTTPIPPPIEPVLEPARLDLPYGPIGPEDLFGEGVSPVHEMLTEEAARQPAFDRLRLGPPTTMPDAQVFDLFGAIEYAVQNSREYQNRMEDLYLATLTVTLERHLFEPRLFAETALQYTGGQADVNYRSALAVTNSVGVRQQLPYGGEIVAQALVDFVNRISGDAADGESAQVILSGRVPLLRGAGMVNLEPLIQAERDLVYEIRRFEDFRRSFAVQVATQYFRLLTLQQRIANRRFNFIVLANLTEQTLALYGAGRISFIEVQRALQSQLSAESSLIAAEDAYATAVDNFKVLVGMPVEQPMDVTPTELDVTIPQLEMDPAELALRYRLDLQTARDRVEDAQRFVQVARNGLLPDLDFTARGSIRNAPDSPAVDLSGDSVTYSAALAMNWPVDRLRERNIYRRALISLERAQRSFVQARDQIIANVRDSVRNIRTAQQVLLIERNGIELAQRRLDNANELLILGRAVDSRNVVEAQQSLLQAQDAYDAARAELQIQILTFLRDTGTLRVDPSAGALGLALDRAHPSPALPPQLTDDLTQ